jgi:alpha-galactosidase
VSAEVILRTAEAMVGSGMRDLGYQYMNIDDFWHGEERAADGTPLANPETFPEGIAALADSVHALGLRPGIYSDAGHMTCGGCFGGHGHEEIDARTYAEWGVDLLKSWCARNAERAPEPAPGNLSGKAGRGCRRPIPRRSR